MCGNVEILASS